MTSSAVIITYHVRMDGLLDNQEAVAAVFAELADSAPNVTYLCTQSGTDGTVFTHLVAGEVDQLTDSVAFKQFQAGLTNRLSGTVSREDVRIVGLHTGREI